MRTTTRLAAMRAAAAAGALAVGLAGFGLGATATAADLANIDDQETTSLTIHKHVKQPAPGTTKARPDGTANLPAGQSAVEGVIFKAYKINLDMTKQASWDTIDTYTKKHPTLETSVCDSKALEGGLTLTGDELAFDPTTDAGVTTSQLGKGAYLICETDTSGAKVAGTPVKVIDKALPFIVTLPFPDSVGDNHTNNWIYQVHSYPKNTVVNKPVKKVTVDGNSHGLNVGDQITYTIDAKIPDIDDNTENFKYFNIFDKLGKESADIKVASVEIGDAAPGTGDFTNGAPVPAGKYTSQVEANVFFAQVHFNTVEGLKYLRENPNKIVRVTIKAKLTAIPTNGNLANTGNLLVDTESVPHDPNTPPTTPTDPTPPVTPPVTPPNTPDAPPNTPPNDPGIPTNTVVSNWGDLKVFKKDNANGKALQGATFQVFNAKEAFAGVCTKELAVDDQNAPLGPVSVNGKTEFTSDADGNVNIAGLFVDSTDKPKDAANPAPDNTSRCYVLVETAAPAGYVLPTGEDAKTPVKVMAGTTVDKDLDIPNTKAKVPGLPMTGASGQVLMMAGGAALVLLSAGTVLVARRRRAED